ncbi:hypothetical protein [Neobacillus sp. Marseille-QA0830]
MSKNDGMNYAPKGNVNKVVEKGEFQFAAMGLDHGHIYGMCNGLIEAGGELVAVYDLDSEKVAAFCETFSSAMPAASEQEILQNSSIHLVASACIPVDRCELGLRVLDSVKHYRFSERESPCRAQPVFRHGMKVRSNTEYHW